MASAIQVVVFDIGGVMIRLAGSWENACFLAGVPYRHFRLTPDGLTELEQLEKRIYTNAISANEHNRRLGDIFQGLYTLEEIAAIYQAIIQEELPGIKETVLALKRFGLRTACLSNTCASHWEHLTNPALYPAIGALDHQHASHLFKTAKPDQQIYRCFEDAAKVDPKHILFFDDREDNIDAARERGWHAVLVESKTPSDAQIRTALSEHGIRIS